MAEDGRVYDTDRVMFLRACLGQLQRATSEGVPVNGYFHWSAQDNFEWVDGFGNRFGLIYVDFAAKPQVGLAAAGHDGPAGFPPSHVIRAARPPLKSSPRSRDRQERPWRAATLCRAITC